MAITHQIIPFGGWNNNLHLQNGACELLITLDVGPRILKFAPRGGDNVFKIFEEQLGGTEEEMWQIRGGHRFWIAPESFPFSYYPDNFEVDYQIYPNGGVILTAPDEMPQGFTKQIEVSLDSEKAKVRLVHRLTNVVDETQEVGAWMPSVMAPGGIEIIPQPPMKNHPGLGPGDFTADRTLILWPFTDLSDGRYYFGPKFITLKQHASLGATKIGLNHSAGWAAYYLDGTLFVKRFSLDAKATYPDRNSNFETFTNEEMLEIETLGPLTKLAPGGVLEAIEEWELFTDIPEFDHRNDDSIEAALKGTGLV
ncbi:MAG TPA: hypothetical protein VGB45_09640 [Abditibacterium sp.]|jgi:hypothetical protein